MFAFLHVPYPICKIRSLRFNMFRCSVATGYVGTNLIVSYSISERPFFVNIWMNIFLLLGNTVFFVYCDANLKRLISYNPDIYLSGDHFCQHLHPPIINSIYNHILLLSWVSEISVSSPHWLNPVIRSPDKKSTLAFPPLRGTVRETENYNISACGVLLMNESDFLADNQRKHQITAIRVTRKFSVGNNDPPYMNCSAENEQFTIAWFSLYKKPPRQYPGGIKS